MSDQKLVDVLHTAKGLEDYLLKKASNHNYFKIYSTLDRVENIIREQALFLSNGKKWNDIEDRENFNSENSDYINFACCFSFSKSENMAMWMLYGGIHKQGAMLKIPPSVLRKAINNADTIEAGKFVENKFVPLCELKRGQYLIKLIDILYYSQNVQGYTIKRSDERYEISSFDIINLLGPFKKRYPWSYENECRLIISVKSDLLQDKEIDQIRFSLAKEEVQELTEDQIVISPNFEGRRDYAKSSLGGKVDWDLCKECNSYCEYSKIN